MRRLAVVLAAGLLLAPGSAEARQRFARQLTHAEGLPVNAVYALGQDAAGFLWIGTTGGVVRWDGIEFRSWAKQSLPGVVRMVATDREGRVLLGEAWPHRRLFQVADDGVEPLIGPEGVPLKQVDAAAFDRTDTLWIAQRDPEVGARLLRETGTEERWESVPASDLGGEAPRRLEPRPGGGMYVATAEGGVWELAPGREPQRLFSMRSVEALAAGPGAALYAAPFVGDVMVWRDGELRTAVAAGGRVVDLQPRDSTLWVSTAEALYALHADGGTEVLGEAEGIRSGGPLLVDREGSLWLGTFDGLIQFPEPDTVAWTIREGLPGNHTRFLERARDGVWVSTWQGLARIEAGTGNEPANLRARSFPRNAGDGTARGLVCVDGEGLAWSILNRPEHPARPYVLAGFAGDSRCIDERWRSHAPFACRARPDGSVWITEGELLWLHRPGSARRLWASLGSEGGPHTYVAETPGGDLWTASREGRVCFLPAATRPREEPLEPERCEQVEMVALDIAVMPSGTPWIATEDRGVLRRTDRGWQPVVPTSVLPSPFVHALTSSPRGGTWVAGSGLVWRVEEDGEGWRVLESVGSWHGIPTSGAGDVLEDRDGTLWLTTTQGVYRIPPYVRDREPAPPRVVLSDVRVDGRRLARRGEAELRHDRNRLELYFAALSYRAPGRIRYRVRLGPRGDWEESGRPQFRFVDLRPGDYRAEVVASLDGERWSAAPATFDFRVLAPWYLRTWAIALFALLTAAALYAAYRARLALLLRLERQRTRIAMDLHDEMGSALGSIGILAGLAADDSVDDAERRGMAGKIAATAEELSTAVADIVWSLRAGSSSLEALAAHLADRGGRMFPGERPLFRTEFPEEWPAVAMGLVVRRGLQRIAIEALHNAARHAAASNVTLGFRSDGARWILWVEDDGRGFDASTAAAESTDRPSAGLGLPAISARAAEIGATVTWSTPAAGGCRVAVRFDPSARGRNGIGRKR